jgi:SAM-dependent methyltransferase
MDNLSPFRSALFKHQDGVALGMVLLALEERDLLKNLFSNQQTCFNDLIQESSASPGYLKIAIRAFISQGWIKTNDSWSSDDMSLAVTESGQIAHQAFTQYLAASNFNRETFRNGPRFDSRWLESVNFHTLVQTAVQDWGLFSDYSQSSHNAILNNCLDHLNGLLIVPIMASLHHLGKLSDSVFAGNPGDPDLTAAQTLYQHLGWITHGGNSWTKLGQVACRYARHYGLMGSYLPLMSNLDRFIFHGAVLNPHVKGQVETHVDRKLNVIASGAAHERYFEDSRSLFTNFFDSLPIDRQPRYIADMGCGDGRWLTWLYNLVVTTTRRGQHLEQHPILMVGADYNFQALEIAESRLRESGVPFLLIQGDISDPDKFSAELADNNLNIQDGLHIRSFIDHNRRFFPPSSQVTSNQYPSSGVYIDEDGAIISNLHLIQNLIEHFERWAPHVCKHGMVILESHTVEPRIAAQHIGYLHNVAFDTYHGFSHQFPVEFEIFLRAAKAAGLYANMRHQIRYPSKRPFVSISLNWFTVADGHDFLKDATGPRQRKSGWTPDVSDDLNDGESLHRLLYERGDIDKPRHWVSAPSGTLSALTITALQSRIHEIQSGKREPRLCLIDYGSGSGLATIELIKELRLARIFDVVDLLGIDFQIHLLDIPSGWFAKGYHLLKQFDFINFHSLLDSASGKFMPLSKIIDREQADLITASMVFHLIPPVALAEVARNFSNVLRNDGELVWNSPDIGPTMYGAELFHNPNRQLRQTVLEMIDDKHTFVEFFNTLPDQIMQHHRDLPEKLNSIRQKLTANKRRTGQERADRQILPCATNIETLEDELSVYFDGETFVRTFEIEEQDIIDTILVPSNQSYLSEIDDTDVRSRLSALIMSYRILPHLRDSPSSTMFGFNLKWTYGKHQKKQVTTT